MQCYVFGTGVFFKSSIGSILNHCHRFALWILVKQSGFVTVPQNVERALTQAFN